MKKASINVSRLIILYLVFHLIFGVIQSFVTLERDFLYEVSKDFGNVLSSIIMWPIVFSTAGEFGGSTGVIIGVAILAVIILIITSILHLRNLKNRVKTAIEVVSGDDK